MSFYKIYKEPYELFDSTEDSIDSYAYKGELVDDEPKGKHVGYVQMEDGSIVDCYKPKSKLPIIMIILAILAVTGVIVYFVVLPMLNKEIAIGGTILKTDVGKNVVTFNGIMSCHDSELDVRFLNGDVPATIKVEGEGVVTQEVSVEPGEYVDTIPVSVTTEDSVAEVVVTIKSNETASTFNALVEIPDNNTAYDPVDGLSGYFEKELIIDEAVE